MTPLRPIRIGIVGAGGVFRRRHLARLANLPDVVLRAVANDRVSSAAAAAAEFGIRDVEPSWEALVARDDLDAVMVGTPPHLHCPVGVAALGRGLHVFSQAPLARDPDEGRRFWTAARERPDLVAVVSPSLGRAPVERRMRDVLASGTIGTITVVDVIQTSAADLDERTPRWRVDANRAGLAALEMARYAEIIDAWLTPYAEVSAVETRPFAGANASENGTPQVVMILGRLENGAAAVEYHGGISTLGRRHDLITIYGSNGIVRCNFEANDVRIAQPGGDFEPHGAPHADDDLPVEADFIGAIRAAARTGRWEPGCNLTLDQANRILEKLAAVRQSVVTARHVAVPKAGTPR